jgi:hypothetical protein
MALAINYNDPTYLQKTREAELNIQVNEAEKENKTNESEAKKELIQKVAKMLVPILGLALGRLVAEIVVSIKRLERLVRETNKIITAANTSNSIIQLRIAKSKRDQAVRILDNAENRLQKAANTVAKIRQIVTVLSIVIRVTKTLLSLLPVPPAPLIERLNKYQLIVDYLIVLLAIVEPVLRVQARKIERLKARLLSIGDILDNEVLNQLLNQGNSPETIQAIQEFLTNNTSKIIDYTEVFDPYKGFKFAIKTEETLGANRAIEINGVRRKYAVAINRDGSEVLKSELSFTLDPNDLIDQLKLVIDQQNLKA